MPGVFSVTNAMRSALAPNASQLSIDTLAERAAIAGSTPTPLLVAQATNE